MLSASCALLRAADHYRTLLNAKHLTLTTQQGATYYYIISADEMPMVRLGGDRVVVERDTFAVSDIRGMRLRTIPRFVLDEDSLTFGRDYAVDHGLLALRRTLVQNRWNAIVLPVTLTGKQVRETFGDEAQVAQVRGFREGSTTIVDYELLSLDTREPVMLANCHYIIRPTREPDLEAGKTAPLIGSVRPEGPLYLIADATLGTIQTLRSDDRSAKLAVQGTYVVRGGQSTTNLKLPPGVYSFGDDGTISQSTDSVAIKAFSSWFVDTSDEPHAYSFYIDGINQNLSSIEGIVPSEKRNVPTGVYDLSGRKVADGNGEIVNSSNGQIKKGIYIINGKKVIVR